MNPKPGSFLLVALAFLLLAVPTVRGQSLDDSARFRGTVVDGDGEPIESAKVTITHLESGHEYSVQTKRKGQYAFNRIMPGSYEILITRDGFKGIRGAFYVIPKGRQTLETVLVADAPDVAIIRNEAIDRYNEGVELAKSGSTEKAIEKLEESVGLNPEIADAHYNLGVLYRETGRTDEAEMALLDALDLDPGIELARVALAEIYFQQGNRLVEDGQFDVAFAVLSEACSYDSEHAHVNYLLGILCVRKGDDEGAVSYFEHYLRLAPESKYSVEVRSTLDKLRDGS